MLCTLNGKAMYINGTVYWVSVGILAFIKADGQNREHAWERGKDRDPS